MPTIKQILLRAFEREEAFWVSIHQPDDLGAVMRGLMYCEESLRELLLTRVKNPKVVRLTVSPDSQDELIGGAQLVNWARALDLIDERLFAALKKLVQLRNSFGHQLERKLSPEEVKELVSTLRGRAKTIYEARLPPAGITLVDHGEHLRLVITALRQTLVEELTGEDLEPLRDLWREAWEKGEIAGTKLPKTVGKKRT